MFTRDLANSSSLPPFASVVRPRVCPKAEMTVIRDHMGYDYAARKECGLHDGIRRGGRVLFWLISLWWLHYRKSSKSSEDGLI